MHYLIGILILLAIAFALIKALLAIASAIVSAIFIFFIKYWAIMLVPVIIFIIRRIVSSEIKNLSDNNINEDSKLDNSMYAKRLEDLVKFREINNL